MFKFKESTPGYFQEKVQLLIVVYIFESNKLDANWLGTEDLQYIKKNPCVHSANAVQYYL